MRADRLLSIILLLQNNNCLPAQKLAEELEVSERTIYRDIEALSYAGVPVYTRLGPGGGVCLDENYRAALAGVTTEEIQSLLLAVSSAPVKDLGLAKPASGLLLKLIASLPAARRAEVDGVRQRVFIDPLGWFQSVEACPHLAEVQKAVWEDCEIEILYERPDSGPSWRRLQPYGLVAKANIWYLVGRQVDGVMRTFRVGRIQEVTVREVRFRRPAEFDLGRYWQESIAVFENQSDSDREPVSALVRVAPGVLRSFASDLVGRYRRVEGEDPRGWVCLQATFPSPGSACSYVLSFGKNAEIVEPASLRQAVLDAARAMVALYAEGEKRE